ncbi:MAG: MarR family transcriptional regulator [Alphaproteobacteria bacterium]|nr:MarR family transcriptional regulator [Alphaproteobacteria bacterium]MDE2495939.1 MarR family transcriptional regulator [Alphaproteobacteria bacterium]
MSNTQTARLRDMLDIAQDEMVMRDSIADLLELGPKTIPELAETLGYSPREVTVWLFGMRRHGMVEEIGRADADGYFQYKLMKRHVL